MPPIASSLPIRYGLKGRVVVMDGGPELKSQVVYVDTGTGRISAVLPSSSPRPAGFETAPIISTQGTIYPGLIELHNHLCYNLLTLWKVPQQYDNRDQWPSHPDYLKLVRGPAQTLGNDHAGTYLAPTIRYVEAKCLAAGVTTSQGITLQGINTVQFFRGNVRNVELPEPTLKAAHARIGDVEPGGADDFLKNSLDKFACVLLHLSEGRSGDAHALERFERLRLSTGAGWAITQALAGIHCAALRPAELELMRANGASIIWSPMSNLLLYGTTADIATAKAKGITIGLGSDWAPTGSKNLLGEMKVARLYSQNNGNVLSDQEIVALATTNPARILGWGSQVGQVKSGMLADLLVIKRTAGDPYARLIEATEDDVSLVTISGIPRYGRKTSMQSLTPAPEAWTVGGKSQAFYFETKTPTTPIVVDVPLKAAATTLADGLKRLPQLANTTAAPAAGNQGTAWRLRLDDDAEHTFLLSAAAAVQYKDVAVPLDLDPLTVADDANYLNRVHDQLDHVPAYLREGLKDLYR